MENSWFKSQHAATQEYLLQRARLLSAHRQDKEGILLYQQLLEIKPQSSLLHNDLAWLLVTAHNPANRNPARAVKHAHFALAHTSPPNAAYLDTLATALFLNGQKKEAIKVEKSATKALGTKMMMLHLLYQLKRFQGKREQDNKSPVKNGK